MPAKLTQEQVEKEFENKGCKLLEIYKGNMISMSYRCRCGNITKSSLVGFRKSVGCHKCSEASGGRKFSYEYVKKYFEKQECKLLSEEYISNNSLLHYKCSCGTVTTIRFSNFQNGRRCQSCKGKSNSEKFRIKDDEIKQFCKKQGCRLVKSWLHKGRTRIEYFCKCGRKTKTNWSNFTRYPNCWQCGITKKSGENCYMYDPDREAIEMRKKFRKICGQHIHRFMKATSQKKTRHTHELLGYRPKDLQEHILNHPNMKNCGKDWHVDHIFPIQAFLDNGILDLKIINHLSNLRPIDGEENLSKADKYNKKRFEKWLKKTKMNG